MAVSPLPPCSLPWHQVALGKHGHSGVWSAKEKLDWGHIQSGSSGCDHRVQKLFLSEPKYCRLSWHRSGFQNILIAHTPDSSAIETQKCRARGHTAKARAERGKEPESVVPNIFCTRDQFHGRQFFHRSGKEGNGFKSIMSIVHFISNLIPGLKGGTGLDPEVGDPSLKRTSLKTVLPPRVFQVNRMFVGCVFCSPKHFNRYNNIRLYIYLKFTWKEICKCNHE